MTADPGCNKAVLYFKRVALSHDSIRSRQSRAEGSKLGTMNMSSCVSGRHCRGGPTKVHLTISRKPSARTTLLHARPRLDEAFCSSYFTGEKVGREGTSELEGMIMGVQDKARFARPSCGADDALTLTPRRYQRRASHLIELRIHST